MTPGLRSGAGSATVSGALGRVGSIMSLGRGLSASRASQYSGGSASLERPRARTKTGGPFGSCGG